MKETKMSEKLLPSFCIGYGIHLYLQSMYKTVGIGGAIV